MEVIASFQRAGGDLRGGDLPRDRRFAAAALGRRGGLRRAAGAGIYGHAGQSVQTFAQCARILDTGTRANVGMLPTFAFAPAARSRRRPATGITICPCSVEVMDPNVPPCRRGMLSPRGGDDEAAACAGGSGKRSALRAEDHRLARAGENTVFHGDGTAVDEVFIHAVGGVHAHIGGFCLEGEYAHETLACASALKEREVVRIVRVGEEPVGAAKLVLDRVQAAQRDRSDHDRCGGRWGRGQKGWADGRFQIPAPRRAASCPLRKIEHCRVVHERALVAHKGRDARLVVVFQKAELVVVRG